MITKKLNRYGLYGSFKYLLSAFRYFIFKYLLRKKYLTRDIFDYKLKLDLSDMGIGRELVMAGAREQQLRYLLSKELKEGMIVLDIGGNIGYYPIMCSKLVGKSGFVYTVEPSRQNYSLLKENVLLNHLSAHIKTYNIAISNKIGKERFYISTHSNLHTFLKKGFDGKYITKGITDKYEEVETVDLSTFLTDKQPIDLVRMDVEGFEVEILEGLEKAIQEDLFKGIIVFEAHRPKYHNKLHSIEKQLKMLFSYGYTVKYITSNSEELSKIRDYGYKAEKILQTADDNFQAVYSNISDADAIKLISDIGGVRDVLLAKKNIMGNSDKS
jgi:FkbM family methyltransferase